MNARIFSDPRDYQVAVLGSLLAAGSAWLDIGVRWPQVLVTLSAALVAQYLGARLIAGGRFEPRSALITGLSLSLLLRSDLLAIAAAAALLAIAGKFLVRIGGKHLFNPANGAIVPLVLLNDHAWVSTGQWGSATIGAALLAGLGLLVITRARRAGTTLSFLATWSVIIFGRAAWLGDPVAIPLHQLQNGALLVFAFFMISDPKTTPDSAAGRVLFGAAVAIAAAVLQFGWYRPDGALLALFFAAPLVPLLDFLLAGKRYRWRDAARSPLAMTGAER